MRLYGREEAEIERLEDKLAVSEKNIILSILKMIGIYILYYKYWIVVVILLGGNKSLWKLDYSLYSIYSHITALAVRTTTAAKVFNIQQGAKASWDRVLGQMEKKWCLMKES